MWETDEVQAVGVIVGLNIVEGAYESEASSVPEGIASKAATNLASEDVGEKEKVTPDAINTDMTCNNFNFILEDCFDSSTLNHISPTLSPSITCS